jgi:dynein heavy chain 2, cytosolic
MQMGLKKAMDTLSAAESLLGKLAGEKANWESQACENSQALQSLPGCSALAAAFVTYAPAESEGTRARLMASWRALDGMDVVPTFDVLRFLSSESELLQWKCEGLQGDQVWPAYHPFCIKLPSPALI